MKQVIYNGKPTLRLKMCAFFDEHGPGCPTQEIAERFNCCLNTVERYRREWRERGAKQEGARCARFVFVVPGGYGGGGAGAVGAGVGMGGGDYDIQGGM